MRGNVLLKVISHHLYTFHCEKDATGPLCGVVRPYPQETRFKTAGGARNRG